MIEQIKNDELSHGEAKLQLEEAKIELSRYQEHYERILQTMLKSRPINSTSLEGHIQQLNIMLDNLKITEERMRQNQAIVNEDAIKKQSKE